MLTDKACRNLDDYLRGAQNEIDRQIDDRAVSRHTLRTADPDGLEQLLYEDLLVKSRALGRSLQELMSWLKDRHNHPLAVRADPRKGRKAAGPKRRNSP